MIFLNTLYTIVSKIEQNGNAVGYQIRLMPESVVFAAHFPGEPILPGACIVQIVLELCNSWKGQVMEIVKVGNLKFLSIISPQEVLDLQINLECKSQEEDAMQIKAEITDGSKEYSKMSLTLKIQE